MLEPTAETLTEFNDSFQPPGDYLVQNVRLDIPDPQTAVFRARLHGPSGTAVWARAWVSNEPSGTLGEAVSPEMVAGSEVTLEGKLRIPEAAEMACMRIESAPLATKHTVHLWLKPNSESS